MKRSWLVLLVLLAFWWGPAFSSSMPVSGGVRERDQFRLISQRINGLEER